MTRRYSAVSSLIVGLSHVVSGTSVRWMGNEPLPTQRIYFSNHSSHLDFIVLWAALPQHVREKVRPIAAKDYWERNFVRRFLAKEVFNAILVDRPHAEAGQKEMSKGISDMYMALDSGYSLIIFPEGTRGADGAVSEFKAGLYHLAKRHPAVELVPVFLENLNRILPKGEVLPVPLLSSATFGLSICLKENESREEFLSKARSAVEQLMGR
jgi:1-acyl-sn-glycerol-3-phosphate acyltransferase